MKKFLLFISFCLLCLSQINAATETWVKVTEAPTDWSGDYLIVYEAGGVAFDGSRTTLDAVSNTKPVTISDNTISTPDCNYYFTIAAVSGGYTIQSKSGYYIGRTNSTKNGLDSSKQTQYVNTISLSEGTLSIENGSASHKLRYNNTSGQTRFRYFTSSQQAVALYKKQEGKPTQVAKPTTTAADKMLYGTKFSISSAEGTTLYYTLDNTEDWKQAESNPVTLNAPTEGEYFTIKAYAVDPTGALSKSETLEKTVTLYPPTPATALIDEVTLTDTKVTGTAYKNFSNVIKYGAEYAGKCAGGNSSIQFNNSTTNGKGSAIFMTQSVGNVNKIVVDWNINTPNGRKLQVYGQNTPYEAYTSEDQTKYIGANAVKGDLLGTIEKPSEGTSTELYITGEYQYILVMEAGEGVLYLNSIKFIWNNPFTGSETTYNKENGTSNIKENKFVTLVDTQNGKALSRNNAAEGTIAGAAATVNTDESNGGKFVTLNQNQIFIDEFQLVPVAEGGFKLYGGTPFIRRYIGYDETGLTTTADETAAAVVKFVQYGDGIVAQFTDGEIIVSDGTNFGKGTPTGTEAPASLAEGATLVPAYVFVSKGNNSTGVEDIEMVETEAPAQYYNLNGVEVKAGNLVPGIYIVRQGNKVSKQFIR